MPAPTHVIAHNHRGHRDPLILGGRCFLIALPRAPQTTSYKGELTCAKDEFGVKNHTCPTGEVFTVDCQGKKGAKKYTCTTRSASVCSFWNGQ
jgi:hypothetical protein